MPVIKPGRPMILAADMIAAPFAFAADLDLDPTREGWLEAAVEAWRPKFVEVGYPLPERIHLSIGFAYGAKAESRHVLGQAWRSDMSADGINHVFIAPMEGDPMRILATLGHELVHVALDLADGHKGRFAEIMTRLQYEGKMTEVHPNEILAAELLTLAAALGPFPHAALSVDGAIGERRKDVTPGDQVDPDEEKPHTGPKRQTGRMIKLVAPCGYVIRTTRRWITDEGFPACPHGDLFAPADPAALVDPDAAPEAEGDPE